MEETDVIIDACSLINLAAAGDLAQILAASGLRWHVPRTIEAQGLSIRMSSDAADARRQPIDLDSVVRAGCLHRCDLDDADAELFVELAADHGDDADAAALTIALSRRFALATDDHRLARLASSRGVRIITTAAVLRRVSSAKGLRRDEVSVMLSRVEQLGRWRPHETDPDAGWWRGNLRVD